MGEGGICSNEGMTWKCDVLQVKVDLKRTSIEEGNDEQRVGDE